MIGQHGFLDGERDRPKTARERRIAGAKDKEHVRLALGSTGRHGYYVFDELITEEAGLVDFLAVGPLGVVVIPMRSDEGCVGLGGYGSELLLDGKPFEDDPSLQVEELSAEVERHIVKDPGALNSLVCFTRAVFELDEESKPPLGTSPIWELSWALDPEGQEEKLTPADIEEVAEKVQEVYGRPPIITPARDEWGGP